MTSQLTATGQTPLWEVTSIEDTFGPVSIGGSNRVKRVNFTILGAGSSYVDVPFSDFNATGVARAIEAHVSDTIDVMQLKGQAY